METAWIEGKVLTLDESEAGELDGRRLALVGKIIADKPLSKGGVQGVFRRVWGEWRELTITELSENTYLFTFKEARAAEQILEEGPWSVMGYCICLHRWQPGLTLEELDFSQVAYWVQVHGLSLDQMSPKNAKKVGDQIGRVLEIEDPISSHGIRRGFFRIRVLIDVSKPLPSGFWASRAGKSNIWVSFKYEHLEYFCYRCGCVGHVDAHCVKDTVMSIPDPSLPKYGPWMRANPSVSSMKALADMEKAPHKAKQVMASRRYQAAEWLRQMDQVALEFLPKDPTGEEFRRALYNGYILCNVLNKVSAGAVPKVVKTSMTTSDHLTEEVANQVSENMRNFLAAVKDKQLLSFEVSDMEKKAGGVGDWKYGGTVKIKSSGNDLSHSLTGSAIERHADETGEELELSKYEQLLDFIQLSNEASIEESKTTNALTFLFDRFGLWILEAYLTDYHMEKEFPLNAMVIDSFLSKVVNDFSTLLVSQGIKLGLFLKKLLKADDGPVSKSDFIEATSEYIDKRSNLQAAADVSKALICIGNNEVILNSVSCSPGRVEILSDLIQRHIEDLKLFFSETRLEVGRFHSSWEANIKRLEHHVSDLEVASSSYLKILQENQMLFNEVLDLKGKIRIYCRVRPLLPGEPKDQSTVDYIGENGSILIVNSLRKGKDSKKVFSFDKVFGPSSSQEQVYTNIQPLIRSILDGYNVCIFAYGQTGSGKTYTMSGYDLNTKETWGVNFRAICGLFQISKTRAEVIEYKLGVQMVEIYNEQVRDLLVIDGSTKRLDIFNNTQLNGLTVPDASWVPVSSTQDVLDLIRIGQKNRIVGPTAFNERSSRSHSILTVHVHGKELVSGSIFKGSLNLVDLAGSERVDKSKVQGDRLKEAQYINRSLSALGDVISALAQKSTHIPYRNSKLTQILQNSLGGHAKTLMLVHISPEPKAIGETMSTLKFAERVASIELGAARSNKETGDILELKEEITSLKLAMEKKEAEVEQLRSITPSQKTKVLRFGISPKPEAYQRLNDDAKSSEARTASSAKQRRPKFTSALAGKEISAKVPEERAARPGKPRSPTAPVRRYLSGDKGALTRNKVKFDVVENQPISKAVLPAKAHGTKSLAQVPEITSTDNNSGVHADHKSDESKLNSLMHSTASSLGKVSQNLKKSSFF
ncbi:kinesin-like protein KIN-14F [Hibiscus syriacus]|uniref:kinesin-like protein KIN-14F n=1 Tax=Hibiscus syriacus TaxID=106335 RepID=UPI0019238218|nr:kinesin-like protein KIN-14F [Hibiscus syriacus]